MSVVSAIIGTAERVPLPDVVIRAAIQRLCSRMATRLSVLGPADDAAFAGRMMLRPIAEGAAAGHDAAPASFFADFLGPNRKFSSCFYKTDATTLQEAEEEALRQTVEHAGLADGEAILELGCGWGSLSLWTARQFPHATVTAVAASQVQRAYVEEEARLRGLTNLSVVTSDMNVFAPEGRFDRIVSVGMLEHVGAPNFRTYFETLNRLLTDDGVALVHAIGKMHGPGATNAFTQKYIFPGGYIPGLSEIVAAIEQAGLWITDIEILRLHYAETCRIWRERFLADPDIPTLFDARFRRMWEFYLAGAELGFRHGGHMVFQIQLAKKRDGVPLTRDYLLKSAG